ncbi:MAG TPA: hypothetical protein VLX91_00760 [Candidatus Acidoferrales bacterium]|nr:hypothetical protein [Candidatus Acidoferrales bacterium]
MKKSVLALSILLAFLAGACAQTNCIWVEKSDDGRAMQRLGISIGLVKLLARPGSSFDLDNTRLSYDTLLAVYNEGLEIRIKDSIGETIIYGGKFGEKMKEESERHNYLIVESTDSDGTTKTEKIRIESIEALPFLLSMIGSKDTGDDIDRIESALERGGVLYIRDFRKNTRLWMYVN